MLIFRNEKYKISSQKMVENIITLNNQFKLHLSSSGTHLMEDFKMNSIRIVHKIYSHFTIRRRNRIQIKLSNHHRKPHALKPQFTIVCKPNRLEQRAAYQKFIYSEHILFRLSKYIFGYLLSNSNKKGITTIAFMYFCYQKNRD